MKSCLKCCSYCVRSKNFPKAHYTLLLNWAILLCDVIPDKNWVNRAVFTGNSAGLRDVLSGRLSHRELRISLKESHSFLSLRADTTMASSQGTQPQYSCPAIHSADEHRMTYSFSNTTFYSVFYAFFSSFRITLLVWPMWLANSKRQRCFYPP
jgi:hypothetical protein